VTQVTYEDIVSARQRIADGVIVSPCIESIPLSELGPPSCRVFCKLDYLQRTGSFKERGARNALLQLGASQRERGAIAASAGNHALGLAYHGMLLDIPITVVMPVTAPLVKVSTCRHLKARVIQHGNNFREAAAHAREIADREKLTYIHGYDDAAIIAGQGTLGLEILEQVANVDAIVIPIGGAGLIAGVALAVKSVRPSVNIIGVEAASIPKLRLALEAGHPVDVEPRHTLADGLATPHVGQRAFAIARQYVDRVVEVTEDEISLAILRMIEREKAVVEGAAATTLAALESGRLPELANKTVVLVLCGGNIDPTILDRVIERGLVADGRLSRFTATISDRPGGLARLASVLAASGASIKQLTHDRVFCGPDASAVDVLCLIETRDHQHLHEVHEHLRQAGIPFVTQQQSCPT
jgi:threonine dehydratase